MKHVCKYCGKPSTTQNRAGDWLCVNEFVCEGLPVPSIEEEFGDDPCGKGCEP